MVRVRYRRADGESAGTTRDRLVPDDMVAGLPAREFRRYTGSITRSPRRSCRDGGHGRAGAASWG